MDKIFRLVGQIVIENDQAKAAVKETTQTAEQGSGGMVSAFKKIGSAVVTYLAVDRVIAFGKSCVESAAQVKAQTAQFEAAFGDLQGTAKDMFNGLSESTGVLATRLQTVGTGAFSQFKGAGLDAADALKKTETYTNLAADAAAYFAPFPVRGDTWPACPGWCPGSPGRGHRGLLHSQPGSSGRWSYS